MKTIVWLNIGLIFSAVCLSCSEAYNPALQTGADKIPVVMGHIGPGSRPTVQITFAVPFDSQGTEYMDDAEVWITDETGHVEHLRLLSYGAYIPEKVDFVGIEGKTYTLHVAASDGSVFESLPETIPGAPCIDSLYAVPAKRTVYVSNAFGEPLKKDQFGLRICSSIHKEGEQMCFFRFQTRLITEYTYYLNPYNSPVTVYEWRPSWLDDYASVRTSLSDGLRQVIPEYEMGFVEFKYSSLLSTRERSAPYPECWIVSMHVHSISKQAYDYYRSVSAQINGTGSWFAAEPGQIKSNIYCLNHSDQNVAGIFEASSESMVQMAFSWVSLFEYKSLELHGFPEDVAFGSQTLVPPEFWVDL